MKKLLQSFLSGVQSGFGTGLVSTLFCKKEIFKIVIDKSNSVWVIEANDGNNNYLVVDNKTHKIVFNRLMPNNVKPSEFYDMFKNKSFERGQYK